MEPAEPPSTTSPDSTPDWTQMLAGWLIGLWPFLGIGALILAALAWFPASRLQFEQSIESLYAESHPRLIDYRVSRNTFGGDEFVIVSYADPDLFEDAESNKLSQAAQDRINALADKIRALPGIEPGSIQSLADALRFPYGRSKIREFLTGILLGSDGVTTAIVARLKPPGAAAPPRAETFREIREIAAAHELPAVVVGEPIQVHEMFRYVEEDGGTLGAASTGLLMIVIIVLFRSLRWMLLPIIVVQVSLLWTRAVLVLSGLQLSMVSSMLNSLVTIIGIATVMHVTVRYRDKRATLGRVDAARATLAELIVPTFWTIVTTASGFAALITSHILPVASFGVMMTLATLMVAVAAAAIVPAGILLGRVTQTPSVVPAEHLIAGALSRITGAVERAPLLIGVSMATLMTVCGAGLFRLQVETDFSKNFRAESPVVKALEFFESKLGGAGTWEVSFPAPARLTEEFLGQVRGLADDLRQLELRTTQDRLTKVVSITDGLDLIPERILFTRLSLETRLGLLSGIQSEFTSSLYNPKAGRMRIMLRAMERQPSETKLKLIEDVEQLARKRFPESNATGLFVLLTFIIESLMSDQLTSSLLAGAALTIQMSIAFRSLRIGLISLIPNIFPILLVIGTMGWIGLPVNIATAMIASVSLGLTVDSSVHYITSYHAARRRGASVSEALDATSQGVGLALVFANVALVAGFSVLTLSHFIPLVYFGILVSVSMLGGLFGNLVLLPLLLRMVDARPYGSSDPAPACDV